MERSKLIHLNSDVAGKVPAPADIEVAELAINTADRQLYSKNAAGTVFPVEAPAKAHTHTAGQVTGLSNVATSGSYTDLSNKPFIPSSPIQLMQSQVEDGGNTSMGLVSGQRIWQSVAAWFSQKVERVAGASGAFYPKKASLSVNAGAGAAEQTVGLRTEVELYGKMNAGGWVGGQDLNLTAQTNAQADKMYGQATYIQVGDNAQVDKLLGQEFVINYVSPSANIGIACAYYVPNLSGVPNINKVGQFYALGSDMPGAPVRISGPYLRVNSLGQMQEIAPSPAGYLSGRVQWCIGRQGWADSQQAALPAGVLCVGAIYLPRRLMITQLGVYVQTGAAGNGKLAIYSQSYYGMLGQKLWQSGDISVAAAGNKTASLSLTLESGLYLVTFVANAQVGVRTKPNSMANTIFGTSSPTSEECVPYYALGSYPANLPDDASSVNPTGFLGATLGDFNFTVSG